MSASISWETGTRTVDGKRISYWVENEQVCLAVPTDFNTLSVEQARDMLCGLAHLLTQIDRAKRLKEAERA